MPRRSAVLALAAVLGLVGCSGGTSEGTKGDFTSYVAIGDSAVSGPEISPQDPKAPPECYRSLHNYPHLAAKALDVAKLDDRSCGGANTDDVRFTVKGGKTQLGAVGRKTQLVTVGIGANDATFAGSWFTSCFLPARSDAACNTFVTTYAPTLLLQTQGRIVTVLSEVKKRAPDAKVLLIGYLRFAPTQGSCDVLPISEANRAASVALEDALAAMQQAAAKQADVGFVDTRTLATGHDICAGGEAWVNGLSSGDGSYLHPKAAGMKAVADEIVRVLRER